MKILFVGWNGGIDYQSDTLLVGLVRAGHDVTDVPYHWWLSEPTAPGDQRLYGLGFSFAGTLPDRSGVDRTRIAERIGEHEFDLVVYGTATRALDYLDEVKAVYRRCEVSLVDGSDANPSLPNPADRFDLHEHVRDGVLFRRELGERDYGVHPIHFGIPSGKGAAGLPTKTRDIAEPIPSDDPTERRDYRFSDERSYYQSYQDAWFAHTRRRAGWDCLRHYEILANRCLPVFDMNGLPATTMVDWPRNLQKRVDELFARWTDGHRDVDEWRRLEAEFHDVFVVSMTAERVAEGMLAVMRAERARPVDWQSRFDRVFCVHSTAQDFKLARLIPELSRVGLWGSPVFELRTTVPGPWDEAIRNWPERKIPSAGVANLGVETRRILLESLARGYERVLLIENDCAFLRDTGELQRILDLLPDRDVVQLDHFFPFNDPWLECARESKERYRINDAFFDPGGAVYYSGTAIAYSRKAMCNMADFLSHRPTAPDGELEKIGCSRAVATTSIALQTVYAGCITSDVTSHHHGYALAGHDYSKYNFPSGYKAGSFIEPGTGNVMNKKEMSMDRCNLKICVYAIAKNEGQFVDRWVDSMSEADEIHVLDTGSTDDTVAKLKARGVHVETKTYSPWRFDTPRNDSMDLCPADTDIYVCTDLDEVLNKGWRRILEDAWLKYKEMHGVYPTHARYDYIWGWGPDGVTPSHKFRYDKIHDESYRWVCPVHEILKRRNDITEPERWLETSGILLEHHADPSKSRGAYLGLLKLAVEEEPDNPRMALYLAREYGFYRKWDESAEWNRRYLDMSGGSHIERAAAMTGLAVAKWRLGDRDLAELWFRRAIEEAPLQREAPYSWAELLVETGQFDRAYGVLARMLARTDDVKEPPAVYVTNRATWGLAFYDFFGFVAWKAGHKDEARVIYRTAKVKWPDSPRIDEQLKACGISAADRLAASLMKSWPPVPSAK